MLKILKYSFLDLARSRWTYIYLLFYLALGFLLLFLNNDLSKGIITIMNIIIVLVPLISTVFGVMYYYNSLEFTELLLTLPIPRKFIFLGQYLGVSISLSLSLILGLGIPFLLYGLFASSAIWNFMLLLVVGAALTFIFTALAFNIAILNDNKIKGFSYAILLWLFLAVVYDGVFLILLFSFPDYPLDTFALIGTVLNPIDLCRIIILLELDISALLGFTGAVFKAFMGTWAGILSAASIVLVWIAIPILAILRSSQRKDF